jgi:L-2,4-diaminobutyrate transaminase
MGLVANAGNVGAYLNAKMTEAVGDHPNVGEVRGEGMLCAVELVTDKANRTFFEPAGKLGPVVVAAMLKRGVIARAMPEGDIIGFAPPLCLSEDEADTIVKVTKEAVEEACAAL